MSEFDGIPPDAGSGADASPAPSTSEVPRRVWDSTALLVLGRVWGSACTLVTLYVLSRHLEPGEFGRFTFYLALFMILDSFVDLGTGQIAVRWTATDPARTRVVLTAARHIRLSMGAVGLVAVGSMAFLMGEEGAVWILLAALYPLTHALELTTTVLKNRIAWARPVAVRAVASTVSLGLVLILLFAGVASPALFLVGVAGGSALGNLMLHLTSRNQLPPSPTPAPPPESARLLLRAALPVGVAGLCQQTYYWVDNLFVRPLAGEVELGRYNLAVRLMSFGIMMGVYASMASLPWLTRQHRAGTLGPAVARLAAPMVFLGGLGTGLAWGLAEPILGLFGEDGAFISAAPALRWLLLAALCVYAGAPLLTGVVAAGRSGDVLRIAAGGLLVNLVGNSLLVGSMGIEGAAIATLATEACVVAGGAFALCRAGAAPIIPGRGWSWLGAPLGFALGRALEAGVGSWLGLV